MNASVAVQVLPMYPEKQKVLAVVDDRLYQINRN